MTGAETFFVLLGIAALTDKIMQIILYLDGDWERHGKRKNRYT